MLAWLSDPAPEVRCLIRPTRYRFIRRRAGHSSCSGNLHRSGSGVLGPQPSCGITRNLDTRQRAVAPDQGLLITPKFLRTNVPTARRMIKKAVKQTDAGNKYLKCMVLARW